MIHAGRRLVRTIKPAADAFLGASAAGALKALRLFNMATMSRFSGRAMRRLGPLLPEHRVGRDNLARAFPDKPQAERDEILVGAWENLGRFGAEFAQIDRIWERSRGLGEQSRIRMSQRSREISDQLRDDGKPALIFSAHLANWEVAAIVAHEMGGDTTVLYRRPNLRAVSDAVVRLRAGSMGSMIPADISAIYKLADALQRGSHVAMLVDQYFVRGVPVTFFGRQTRANPLLARLARRYECPIHGARVIRHEGNQFEIDITDELAPVRHEDGKIDVQATTQAIYRVIEGWIREHPEQWLWLHRRWRDDEEGLHPFTVRS